MAFINPLEDAQITIQYDNGPGTTPTPYCEPGNDVDISFIPQPGSRVLVRVEMNFLPLVPGLLPYPSFTITAPNARRRREQHFTIDFDQKRKPIQVFQGRANNTIHLYSQE
jgi:hypothetical protein